MTINIKMPSLRPEMKSAVLCEWKVKEGDTIKSGNVLYEIIKKGTLSRVSKITIAVYAVCAVLGLVKYFLTKKERNKPAVLSKSEIISIRSATSCFATG